MEKLLALVGTCGIATIALLFTFGGSAAASDDPGCSAAARAYGAIFAPPTRTIALNWAKVGAGRGDAAIAHELAHLMVNEIAGGVAVPAWLDEGLATIAEDLTAAGDQRIGRAVAVTGAMT